MRRRLLATSRERKRAEALLRKAVREARDPQSAGDDDFERHGSRAHCAARDRYGDEPHGRENSGRSSTMSGTGAGRRICCSRSQAPRARRSSGSGCRAPRPFLNRPSMAPRSCAPTTSVSIPRVWPECAPPRHAGGTPAGCELPGRASYFASGEVIGGLFFGHDQTGVFTQDAEDVVNAIAAHAAVAIDNARLYDDARRRRCKARSCC